MLFLVTYNPQGGGHPEWHICEDVLPLLKGNCDFCTEDGTKHHVDKWDMILAFPPCTHLCVSGGPHFEKKRQDGRQRAGIEFFCQFLDIDCKYVAIENPVNIISGNYVPKWFPDLAKKYKLPRKPTQYIQPYMFGDRVQKKTGLWLKGLPPLKQECDVSDEIEWKEWTNDKGQHKRGCKFFYESLKLSPEERSKVRSKTFPGIAHAMAVQWSKVLE